MLKWFAPLVLATAPVLADGSAGGKAVECYCTDASGGRIEMGATICLQVDGRMFTAQCQMSLNVPMWREIREGCLSSRAEPPQPLLDPGAIDPHV